MHLFYFPLENLEQRMYSTVNQKMKKAFDNAQVTYTEIIPKIDATRIDSGGWVMSGSNHCRFCLEQMSIFMDYLHKGKVKNGDILYFDDLWFPGLESIFYSCHLMKLRVGVYGFIHAGSFTYEDFVYPMRTWARSLEKSWFTASSGIFVGSEQTKEDIIKYALVDDAGKVVVTGLPFEVDKTIVDKKLLETVKESIVLFSHRDDPDKHIEDLLKVMLQMQVDTPLLFSRTKFIITAGGKSARESTKKLFLNFPQVEIKDNLSKDDYYTIVAKSKVLFSAATQENFGVAVQEGMAFQVFPVCPNRVSYKYLLHEKFLYNTLKEATHMIVELLSNDMSKEEVSVYCHHQYAAELIVQHMLSKEGL